MNMAILWIRRRIGTMDILEAIQVQGLGRGRPYPPRAVAIILEAAGLAQALSYREEPLLPVIRLQVRGQRLQDLLLLRCLPRLLRHILAAPPIPVVAADPARLS